MNNYKKRTDYILELRPNSEGQCMAKWKIPLSQWQSTDTIRLYENSSKAIGSFLEEKPVVSQLGSVIFDEYISPDIQLRYIQGGNELSKTSPFPRIILGMTNEIYYPAATANIQSIQISFKKGQIILKTNVQNAQPNDFVGIYNSLLAKEDEFIFKMDNDIFNIEMLTNVAISSRYFARYITEDSLSNKHTVRRTFQMLGDLSVHEKYEKDLTEDEKYHLLRVYPKIELDLVKVTDNETRNYNCIAWSLGLDDRWVNPLGSIESMVEYYKMYGCEETTIVSEQKIDLWATVDLKPRHGSKFFKTERGESIWESKQGESKRITHNRQGVENGTYGIIVKSFTAPQLSSQYSRKLKEWTNKQLMTIDKQIHKLSLEIIYEFENRFLNWKNVWFTGETKYTSNTNDLKLLIEYESLYELGESIIPLLVKKLCDEDNFPALVLYDDLQMNHQLKLNIEDSFDIWVMGEQERAAQTILKWINEQNE